jgi:hypothetical protein
MERHIPTLITLTREERDAGRLLANNSGLAFSRWVGEMIRRKSKLKMAPPNKCGSKKKEKKTND